MGFLAMNTLRMLRPLLLLFAGLACCAPAEPYVRANSTDGSGRALEVAAKRFVPAGQTKLSIWLVGVSHVGSSNYFTQIQALLNACDLVLYEGVDGGEESFRDRDPESTGDADDLQVQLAKALGMEFQLFAIDYSPPHFRNSDLSSTELFAILDGKDPGAEDTASRKELENLLETMSNESLSGKLGSRILTWVGSRPDLREGMAYVMIELLGNLRGDLSEYAGLPTELRKLVEVLIRRRNDVVLRDVREFLDAPGQAGSVAVFYGAGHMADLQKRLTLAHDLRLEEEVWYVAMEANLDRSRLSALEKTAIRWFAAEQARTMRRMAGPSVKTKEPRESDCAPEEKE